MQEYKTADEYISNFSTEVQHTLEKIRKLVRDVAPEAKEEIAYGIPTYKLNGKNIVHFGAYPKHIGVYPGPSVLAAMADDLKKYHTSKGTVQFQLDEPIPYDLIRKIVKTSVEDGQK